MENNKSVLKPTLLFCAINIGIVFIDGYLVHNVPGFKEVSDAYSFLFLFLPIAEILLSQVFLYRPQLQLIGKSLLLAGLISLLLISFMYFFANL